MRSLEYKLFDPEANPDEPAPLLVLCHGYGAPANDLHGLCSWLRQAHPSLQGVRFAFPAAPLSIPFVPGGRAWWSLNMLKLQQQLQTSSFELLEREVPDGIAEVRAAFDSLLVLLRERYKPKRVVVGGFSQGAMLSCDWALRNADAWDGLVLLSGTLICRDEWGERLAEPSKLREKFVFQSHGCFDSVLPYSQAERLRCLLIQAGISVCWTPFDGGHEIPPSVLMALGTELRSQLSFL